MTHNKTIEELDSLLDSIAREPDSFENGCAALARAWDRAGFQLKVSDPLSWRNPLVTPRPGRVATIEEQLRSEIDAIIPQDRDDEARLARRIEFLRVRLALVMNRAGLQLADLAGRFRFDPSNRHELLDVDPGVPTDVARSWLELHCLRVELVERNLYLALINVERYAHLGASRLDLIQEGSAALFRAVDGFDWRRGLLFRTYAVHWLNQAFRSFLYNNGQTVRVPVYLQKALKHVKGAIARLGDPGASTEAIAREADLGEHIVENALSANRNIISMDYSKGDGTDLSDCLSDESAAEIYSTDMEEITLEDGLSEALGRLTDRERNVIEKRFGIGRPAEQTLSQVAGELGVSLERVRQIQMRAIHKMNTPTLRRAVSPFL